MKWTFILLKLPLWVRLKGSLRNEGGIFIKEFIFVDILTKYTAGGSFVEN